MGSFDILHVSEFEGHENDDGFVIAMDGAVYDWCEQGMSHLCGPITLGVWHTPLYAFPTFDAAMAAVQGD